MSTVEQTSRTDPAGAYHAMDFGTRDRYRHVVESITKRSTSSEDDVARAAIRLAHEAGSGRMGHVGYFLIDNGRSVLEHAVRMRQPVSSRVRRLCKLHQERFDDIREAHRL